MYKYWFEHLAVEGLSYFPLPQNLEVLGFDFISDIETYDLLENISIPTFVLSEEWSNQMFLSGLFVSGTV